MIICDTKSEEFSRMMCLIYSLLNFMRLICKFFCNIIRAIIYHVIFINFKKNLYFLIRVIYNFNILLIIY